MQNAAFPFIAWLEHEAIIGYSHNHMWHKVIQAEAL